MTALTSIQATANTPASSVRAQSNEALTQAIHSPGDEEYTLNRTRTCLKLYYDPDMNAADRAEMIDSYAKALRSYPKWAVAQAFNQWERDKTHRPSPAALVSLAGAAVKRVSDEISRRAREAEEAKEREREPLNEEQKFEADCIVERAGFTAKRATALKARPLIGSFAEADQASDKPRRAHWTETEAPDSPRMLALRKSRDENRLIAESRAAAEAGS